MREALQKEKKEAEEVRKALEDKVTEEKVRNGEMDPDEVSRPSLQDYRVVKLISLWPPCHEPWYSAGRNSS